MPFAERPLRTYKWRSVYTFRMLFVKNLLELERREGALPATMVGCDTTDELSTFLAIVHRRKCECDGSTRLLQNKRTKHRELIFLYNKLLSRSSRRTPITPAQLSAHRKTIRLHSISMKYESIWKRNWNATRGAGGFRRHNIRRGGGGRNRNRMT